MVAISVARLTSACCTPSTRLSVFSTRRTQDAQVIPPIARVQVSVVSVAVAVMGVIRLWCVGASWGRRELLGGSAPAAVGGRSGDEGVAGLVDRACDVGTVHRFGGGDRDGAGGQIDGDAVDAVDGADLA